MKHEIGRVDMGVSGPDKNARVQASLRLQVHANMVGRTHYQLATGTLFIPTSHPLPPDTLLDVEFEDEQGHIMRPGVARIVAWRTLLGKDETFETPGMRLQLVMDDGNLPQVQDPAELEDEAWQDISEELAARVDLDETDEISWPIPLPELPEDALPSLNYQDVSELRAGLIDLDEEQTPDEQGRISSIEKRKHTRLNTQIPVRARKLPDGVFFSTMAWNISSGGIFLRCGEEFDPGTELELELQLPVQAQPIQCRAEVVRCHGAFDSEQQPRIPGLGLRFTILPDGMERAIEALIAQVGPAEEPLAEKRACAPDLARTDPPAAEAPHLSPAAHKKMVVNALITALEISRVEAFRGNQTLRYLLDVWYLRYHRDQVVDLSLLWNTLAADELVSPIDAALPLYIFALTRQEHGLGVQLPEGLKHFENCSQTMFLARRRISEAMSFREVYERVAKAEALIEKQGLDQVHRRPSPQKLEPWPRKTFAKKKGLKAKGGRRLRPTMPSRTRRRLLMVLIFAALALLGISSLLEGRRATEFDVSAMSGSLELDGALVQGDRMQAVLVDERWPNMNEEDKRLALHRTILKLDMEGVRSLLLFDTNGALAASVRAAKEVEGQPLVRLKHEVLMEPK